MRLNKYFVMLVILLISATVLSACATGTEDAATATVAATAEEAAATEEPTVAATEEPTVAATEEPTVAATEEPTVAATEEPTAAPTEEVAPTEEAAEEAAVTDVPTEEPTVAPTDVPTEEPTVAPTDVPTEEPTVAPTDVPTEEPTVAPTEEPMEEPVADVSAIAKREGDVVSANAGAITSVCLVTDLGRVNDGSFNQSAYNGMVAAAEDFGLRSTFIETQSQADYAKNIQTCLDEGYGAIVTVGFLIADATREAAVANPETFFIGVDQFFAEPLPNLVGIQFREDQAGFLVGVMAALVSESGTIGGVYGEEIPPVVKFRNGFEQGAKYINPDINVLGVYVGSFIDQPAGRETAENLLGEGADVIFGAGGPTGSAGIQAAAEKGVKVIGVDQDEYLTTFGNGETPGAEFIITSAVKRVDQGVYDMLESLSAGVVAWPEGSLYLMDASVQGVGFAPSHDAEVAEDVIAKVEEVLAMLASGELSTGVDPVTGELLAE